MQRIFKLLAGLGLAMLAVGLAIQPAAATHVTPVFVPGNPNCVGRGYQFGFKPQPEPPPSDEYTFPGTAHTVTIASDGTRFDWTSTVGIDAVIVKGGPNANVYVYDPPAEEFSDTGLRAPTNPNNNQPYAISHIEFCLDWEVDVEKTAETSFTRTYEWDIEKSVSPDTWDLFAGDSGTSEYTVEVDQTGFTDSDWAVSGEIWVENNTPVSATITSVSDVISGPIAPTVVCPPLPAVLAPGDSLHCTYSSPLPDGSDRTNTVTVGTTGQVGGGQATADVNFGSPTTLVNDTIDVDDTNGDSWQFSVSGSETYQRTFTCDEDDGLHDNTAIIVETGQSDSASVTVNCYSLAVEKTTETSLTRTWTWSIEKTADTSQLNLSPGQSFLVTYWVDVNASSTRSDFAVAGEIWISNPNPARDADLTSVADVVSPAIAATVDCPSLTVPAGGLLHCSYDGDLPNDDNRTNTATATLQNIDFDPLGVGTPSGTMDFSGSAAVDFAAATITEIDEEIMVSDSPFGELGEVDASRVPASFHYSATVGPFTVDECGENLVTNTAFFETNDTGTTGDSSWTVTVFVDCPQFGGCTLTQGYWKTHSEFGPAPYDDNWAQLPNGASTPFFLSSQNWFEVFWTAPKKGNAYYTLAHQYMAAELNELNGASVPAEVVTAMADATTLFGTHTPGAVGALKGNNPIRAQFIQLAGILGSYNEGLTGPGHCDEDSTSAP